MLLVAVAKLYSLELTSGSAGRNDCTTKGAAVKNNLNSTVGLPRESRTQCANIKIWLIALFFRFNILLIAQT